MKGRAAPGMTPQESGGRLLSGGRLPGGLSHLPALPMGETASHVKVVLCPLLLPPMILLSATALSVSGVLSGFLQGCTHTPLSEEAMWRVDGGWGLEHKRTRVWIVAPHLLEWPGQLASLNSSCLSPVKCDGKSYLTRTFGYWRTQ